MKKSSLRWSHGLVGSLLAIAPACLSDGGDEPAVELATEALYKSGGFGWSRDPNGATTTVPVCWDERDYPKGPAEPARSALKDFVRRAMEETWQRESGVMFTGWGDCHSNGHGVFGINLHMELSDRGMAYVFHPFEAQHADVHLPIGGGTTSFLRYTAIHEAGHALGLNHEQARGDNPSCTEFADGDWAVGLVPGTAVVTPFDARSVMNYCGGNATELSPLDILGIQRLYGRKPTASFVNARGGCVNGLGTAVMIGECGRDPSLAFVPFGDAIRAKFSPGYGVAAAPAGSGIGPLAMAAGATNPSWDRYALTGVTLRGLAGKKLNVAFASTAPGAVVQTWEDGSMQWAAGVGVNELWTFLPDLTIRGVGGQCLDATSGNVTMQPCLAPVPPAQQWKTATDGQIMSLLGGGTKCLEADRDETDVVTPLATAQPVRIAGCNGSLRQKWTARGPVTTADRFGCLSAAGTFGATVSQAACNGGADQVFDVHW